MSIKLTILKTGETLISDMQEVVSNEQQNTPQAYILNNPHLVRTKDKHFLTEEEKDSKKYGINVLMTPWILLSSDKKIIIPVDIVTTIVEPIEGVKKMFLDKNEVLVSEEKLNG
tara:strand:+ start:160 stop:501 length:342 start_codon:yes stop_codon:yes gene_type:complete